MALIFLFMIENAYSLCSFTLRLRAILNASLIPKVLLVIDEVGCQLTRVIHDLLCDVLSLDLAQELPLGDSYTVAFLKMLNEMAGPCEDKVAAFTRTREALVPLMLLLCVSRYILGACAL